MNRRDFLRSLAAVSATVALPDPPVALGHAELAAWRTFEVTTRVDVTESGSVTRVWVPVPLTINTPFQRPLGNRFHAEGGTAHLIDDRARGFGLVAAEFPAGSRPVLIVTSRVQTRNISVDLTRPAAADIRDRSVARYLEPSQLIPSDGIVRTTATAITAGASTELEKARAIYSWIVERTFRDPNTKGCGLGDIRFMLETSSLGGKCADLNALFVGLAHAAALPARDVYGIRVAKSELGYRSLGISSDDATRAQHCRAEVYVKSFGWIPVDPADVLKVMLEEPPSHRPLEDDMVRRARVRLFGSWEMNWIAYNFEHDVALPGSSGRTLPFFMYPQGEIGGTRLDSLDPASFRYTITAKPSNPV